MDKALQPVVKNYCRVMNIVCALSTVKENIEKQKQIYTLCCQFIRNMNKLFFIFYCALQVKNIVSLERLYKITVEIFGVFVNGICRVKLYINTFRF